MLRKRVYNDGSVKYFDAFTNKEVKIHRVGTGKLGRMPDYVFRYISPGVTARDRSQDGIPGIPIGINRNAGRGTNAMKSRKRLRQKH